MRLQYTSIYEDEGWVQTGTPFIFITVWIGNYIYKVWNKIAYTWISDFIPHFTGRIVMFL